VDKSGVLEYLAKIGSNAVDQEEANDFIDTVITFMDEKKQSGLTYSSLEDLSPLLRKTHLKDVENIFKALLPFHEARERTYNLSFAKRGEVMVWGNLGRKYDRIDGLISKVLIDGQEGTTLIDTLVDLAIYALKWVAVIKVIRPADLEEWVLTQYVKDTKMSNPDALAAFGLTFRSDPNEISAEVRRRILEAVNEMAVYGYPKATYENTDGDS
jgi:hypothetical protein